MNDSVENRNFKRFEIPDAKVKFKKRGLLYRLSSFSQETLMINLGQGGISFYSKEKFDYDKKLIIQILIPEESQLTLTGKVRWVGIENFKLGFQTGVQFDPFGKDLNSEEALKVIIRLENRYYIEKEKKLFFDPYAI